MTVTNTASTQWNGALADGTGTTTLATGESFDLTWKARAEGGGINPEELIASAHASCFSMALAHMLGEAGFTPTQINSASEVDFVVGTGITAIRLSVEASVPEISDDKFQEVAAAAKAGCPVSKALAGVDITLTSAKLV